MKNGPIIPSYMEKILKELQHLQIPKGVVEVMNVRHDDDCEIWKTGICTCNPDIELPDWPGRS